MSAVALPAGAVLMRATAADRPAVDRLWQLFRHDLVGVVDGWPYADGRYRVDVLDADPVVHLALRPHPRTGEPAPVALSVVSVGAADGTRSVEGFWVHPALRGRGVGRAMAIAVIGALPGAWSIGSQHANAPAGAFWRSVAEEAFGPAGWEEVRRPVPPHADAPDDHVLLARTPGTGVEDGVAPGRTAP